MNCIKTALTKKKHPKNRQTKTLRAWFIRTCLFGFGLMTGLLVPWYFYINYITDTIVQDKWDVPSVAYARPLELYQGLALSPEALVFELDLLGYRATNKKPQSGQYQFANNSFIIHSKGFQFPDLNSPAQIISLSIKNNQLASVSPPLARLEPHIIGRFYTSDFENRLPIDLAAIPDTMIRGLQAVEDRDFKNHHGVSWFGILRAAVKNLLAGEVVQGGSTITQQLVKNKLSYNQNSLLRKAHEAMAASILETKMSKAEILESYFNEVYWGQEGKAAVHGVVEAAQFYFAKPVSQLSIAEQALLIGIIKGPSWYNPYRQTKRALLRRDVVLKVWLDTGVIDTEQYQISKQSALGLSKSRQLKTDFDDFMDVVRKQINSQFSLSDLRRDGLRIFTTMDPYVQFKTTQTARQTRAWLDDTVESAILVSGTNTGELVAVSGSQSAASQYNRALLAKRQIGSLIKPLVYLAGLELLPNFDLQTQLQDAPLTVTTQDQKTWQPKNWDGKSMGAISAMDALIYSRNQATVELGMRITLTKFIGFLQQVGLQVQRNRHPALFLGAMELTPFEVQHVFGLFSSRGGKQYVNSIRYVTDQNNQVLSRSQQSTNHQISVESIDAINRAMHLITTAGTARKLTTNFQLSGPLFGKTGTTNAGKDSWYVGFDRRYLATVWVGRDDNKATPYSGSSGALVLWGHLFKNL
ncbi:transglycosylase domain-containing protein [Marinicella sp. S1101]|uniref:transglycosylase domain-containing protein n=1 Tax=Marinicella marina TaxID=2996016 RepID=UPI002260859E|nr:transglycosylase domain-containing protein [Marinicella marina]MCX7553231.1 transglycosylase domain-containing protein [Marinicella marina]MDJ1138963.1 transglycosylase domain-containing protein [Marinicella marina]